MLTIFIFSSLLEAVGIGSIGPFISLATNPSLINDIEWVNKIYLQTGLPMQVSFVAFLGLIIAVLYCVKSFFYFWVRAYIAKFSFSQKSKLVCKLLTSYLFVPYAFHLNKNSARFIKNIVVETQKITYDCILPVLSIASNSVIFLALLLILIKSSFSFMAGILLISVPIFSAFYLLRKIIKLWSKKGSLSNQEMIRIINHSLGSVKETKVIGCENYFQEQIKARANIFSSSAARFHAMQILPRVSFET